MAELAAVTPEHPSPVSVMDASALRDNDSSPIKQLSNALKGKVSVVQLNFTWIWFIAKLINDYR